MKINALFLIFFVVVQFLCLNSLANFVIKQNKINDLHKELVSLPRDSNQLIVLHKLGQAYLDSFPDSSIFYNEKAKILARELNLDFGIARSLLNIGIVHFEKFGDLDKAESLFFEALELFKKHNDLEGIIFCYNFLGNIYMKMGEGENSLKFLLKGLTLCDSINDLIGIAQFSNDLGILYTDIKENSKAIAYLKKSLAIRDSLQDKRGIGQVYNNLARYYEQIGEVDSALENYIKSFNISEEIGILTMNGITACNIGKLYIDKAEYQLSEDYYQKALVLAKSTKNLDLEAMANIYMGISFFRQLDYQNALQSGLKGLALSQKIGSLPYQKLAFKGLAETSEKLDSFRDAYYYHKEFKSISDSISTLEGLDKMKELELNYDNEKQAKENEALKDDYEKQKLLVQKEIKFRNFLLIVAFFTLIFGYIYKKKLIKPIQKINRS